MSLLSDCHFSPAKGRKPDAKASRNDASSTSLKYAAAFFRKFEKSRSPTRQAWCEEMGATEAA